VLNSSTSPVTINPSQGFVSLTAGSTGRFTLTLGASNGGVPTYDPYVRLLNVSASQVGISGLAAGSLFNVLVISEDVAGASGNPSIVLQPIVLDSGGTGPEENVLANGSTLLVEITLSNTTAY
jgi:hypothetical protein